MPLRLTDYPQLKLIAWNRREEDLIEEEEAFALYERNWRYVDEAALEVPERQLMREVRADRYGIRTVLEMDGIPIKFEVVSEGRIEIQGNLDPMFRVPTLSRDDMYAEKLLANADRGLDKAVMSRDIIDLAMMIDRWGAIPERSWEKVHTAYGAHATRAFQQSIELIRDEKYLINCLCKMHMDEGLAARILAVFAG